MRAFGAVAIAVLLSALPRAVPAEPARRVESPGDAVARQHFDRGAELFRGGDYNGAVAEFELAYGAKKSPSILYNIGAAYEAMFQYGKALEYYDRYLTELQSAPRPKGAPAKDEVGEVTRRAAQIRAFTAIITLRSSAPGTKLFVDGRDAGTAPATLRLGAGTHRAEASAEGYQRADRGFQVVAGRDAIEELTLSPLPRDTGGTPPWLFWSAAGLTAAAGIASGILSIRYMAARSEFHDDLRPDAAADASRRNTVANVAWGITAVAAAGTGILFFTTDWEGGTVPGVAPRAARVTLHGSF
jgi:tetratricopeptide (TPR) repeat protein